MGRAREPVRKATLARGLDLLSELDQNSIGFWRSGEGLSEDVFAVSALEPILNASEDQILEFAF